MRPSPKILVPLAAALAAVVAGGTGFVVLDKTVTLSVDGETSQVRSFARDVGDVLEEEGIEIGEHDVVAPAVSESIGEGERISVRYGRLLTLEVDGASREVWTTAGTVDEALTQLGMRVEGAYLSASRSRSIGRDGLALELRTPKKISVVADGATVPLTSTAETVADALAQAKITMGDRDRLNTVGKRRLVDGMTITVKRVTGGDVTETAPVPAETVRTGTADLFTGQTRTQTESQPGVLTRTFREVWVDGVLESRALLSEAVTTAPVSGVVLVGTKARPAPEPEPEPEPESSSGGGGGGSDAPPPAADGLNWAALAECESGGNPRAVNPAGYYGLYQFDLGTWRSVGGSGNPADASASEQTSRAQALYASRGRSPWPYCGRFL